MRLIPVSLICLFLLSFCSGRENADINFDLTEETEPEIEVEPVIDPIRIQAQTIADSLDDRCLASQVLISGIDGKGSLPPHMKALLEESPAGGVMLFRYNLDTGRDDIISLINETASLILEESGIPPFIAVDHEGGYVNRFPSGTASMPAPDSYFELYRTGGRQEILAKIQADSNKAGREINELGINLNLAPVAESLNDFNRSFLSSRSFGPDISFTGDAALSFVIGMEQAGVLCVIKHFPGNAGLDPHYSASLLDLDRAALDDLVYPFVHLFNNGARAVMVAHTLVPVLDGRIASLSPVILNNWLRGELGFGGIIISDDFSMAAAGTLSPEEAAVQSIAAGADMVLVWQPDLKRTHQAILSALENGQLSRERLRDAAERIIYEKIRMELIDGE